MIIQLKRFTVDFTRLVLVHESDLVCQLSTCESHVTTAAHKNGYFEAELAPVEVEVKKKKETFSFDEHPRETSVEKLGTLPPVFKKDGTVSAGNASVMKLY